MRAFVSVDCDPLVEGIRAAQEPFRDVDGIRVVDPEGAHVTLKFLGDIEEDRVPAVEEALAAAVGDADVGPFDLRLTGYGAFPSTDYISVVWVGADEGSAELTRLQAAVEDRLVALGFDSEDHEFTPHVTIARMDDAREKTHVKRVVAEETPDAGTMRVESVALTESTLTRAGPEYDTVARIPL
ncbi:RNA 2',3'-cyclic phosphodiesterase [Halomarina litorea]|uniref:RNA 2',3'-cyclic phosphodiesterase n=1 Tax=Halomarina litorea TaxID=2961595 RepID=UPI0034A1D1D5